MAGGCLQRRMVAQLVDWVGRSVRPSGPSNGGRILWPVGRGLLKSDVGGRSFCCHSQPDQC